MKKIYLFTLLAIILAPLCAQNHDQFTVEDYLLLDQIGSPRFSPDGKFIAYNVGKKDSWDGDREWNIWLAAIDKSRKIQLTNSPKRDSNPLWSADGSMIGFLSSRSEKTQVHVINLDGGEARQVTFAEEGVRLFRWIENGRIAYVSNEPRDTLLTQAEEAAGGGYVVGTKARTSAIWIQSIKDKEDSTKVTDGSYYISDMDADSKGERFAIVKVIDSDLFNRWVASSLAVIDSKGKELFTFEEGKVFNQPRFSPDDSRISFVATTVGYSASNSLFVTNLKTGSTDNLTAEFDPTISQTEWVDNQNISFSTPRNVYSGVYQVSLSGKITTIYEPQVVINTYALNPGTKKIAYIGSTDRIPAELYVNSFKGKHKKALVIGEINQQLKDEPLGRSGIVKYPSFDGFTIEAVVTYPPDYKRRKKYPLVVVPHGGPDGIVMDRFRLLGQLFAQEGMITFEPNFRGGIGYGSEFYRANRGRLGDIDYQDIMAGLDYLIQQGSIDTSMMVVGGWSYGGYMTNWIIGHTSRFKAAVSVAGIANTVSMYAQSDINHGEIARWEFKGVPVTDIENFTRSSPLYYLQNCTTPTLVLHGKADARVPVAQAWEVYRALVDLGIEVDLVLYPDAGHGISAPKQFADVCKRWVGWYNRFLK